jgi:hypothetical protein
MRVESIRQVVHLLSSTQMTVVEIAERMSCTKSSVISINRRFQVRPYRLESRKTVGQESA